MFNDDTQPNLKIAVMGIPRSNGDPSATGRKGLGVVTRTAIKEDDVVAAASGDLIPAETFERQVIQKARDEAVEGPETYGHYVSLEAAGKGGKARLESCSVNAVLSFLDRGSIATFVNHSCRPNCRYVVDMSTGGLRVLIVALRDINAGEEITVSYKDSVFRNLAFMADSTREMLQKRAPLCRCYTCRESRLAERDSDEESLKPRIKTIYGNAFKGRVDDSDDTA